MVRNGIDLSELDAFTDRLIQSSKEASKVQKKFLQQQGTKLLRKTKAQVRVSGIQTRTGNYMKSIKRGKVYTKDGAQRVRVYSNAPHAHLIEEGHDQVVNPPKEKGRGVKPGKGIGDKVGHVEGHEVFLEAYEAYAPVYERDCEGAVDEMIRKI